MKGKTKLRKSLAFSNKTAYDFHIHSQNEEPSHLLRAEMKYSNANNSAHPRKQQATISSTVVKCICITASCIVTACGLLGLGVTCFVLRLTDPFLAPCPLLVTIVVFGAAGLLFFFSFMFLMVLCRKRNSMKRKAQLDDLPVCVMEEPKKNLEERSTEEEKEKRESANPEEPHSGDDNFENQKSADVSLWIEQQESREDEADDYPLENRDGAASHITEDESSEVEITPL